MALSVSERRTWIGKPVTAIGEAQRADAKGMAFGEEGYKMRVITGTARGRKLTTPGGQDVRPTTDQVKESVFSVIQFSIEGRTFLDAFAGSGQMGIEALSRGAEKAVFVDRDPKALQAVRQNLAVTKLTEKADVMATDTLSFLERTRQRFDIAFLDPPYQTGILQRALEKLPAVMNDSGIILCEHPAEEVLPEMIGDFAVKKHYRYGKIMITVYSHKEVEGI